MIVGELLTDNEPFIPNVSNSNVLLTRAVAGGSAGAAVFKARNHSMLLGAAVGAVAAVGVAYASHYVRRKAASHFEVSDRTVALWEDGIALGAGLIAIAMARPRNAEPSNAVTVESPE